MKRAEEILQRSDASGSLFVEEYFLPEGWKSSPLAKIIESKKGKRPTNLSEIECKGALPYIDIEAFEKGKIRKYADPSSSVMVEAGDIVVVWDGARCGYAGKAPSRGALGSTLMALKPNGVDPGYLLRFLHTSYDIINSNPRGTGIPHVEPDLLWNLIIPLPPLYEQKRIVAKLEELLPSVDAVRDRLIRTKAIMMRLRQSVVASAVSGRLTEDWRGDQAVLVNNKWTENHGAEVELESHRAASLPLNWGRTRVDDVCSEIVDCPHSTPKWTTTGEICLRTTNFRPGLLDLSEVRYVSVEIFRKRTAKLEPMPGDVLYSREGGILGIACMVPKGAKVCLGQRMMLMRTDSSKCISAFLMHTLNSPQIQKIVGELTGGSASPHINVKEIKEFPVLVPPLSEQTEIVDRVNSLFNMADKIERSIQLELLRVEEITRAILGKAFRGDLVARQAGFR